MKNRCEAPIGVFDSGVGGLTVVREIMRNLPNEEIVYFWRYGQSSLRKQIQGDGDPLIRGRSSVSFESKEVKAIDGRLQYS